MPGDRCGGGVRGGHPLRLPEGAGGGGLPPPQPRLPGLPLEKGSGINGIVVVFNPTTLLKSIWDGGVAVCPQSIRICMEESYTNDEIW